MTPRTLTRRPLGLALAPAPERPAPRPAMTWAEMARAEGHRRGVPGSPGSVPIATRMLRALANGPLLRSELFDRYHGSAKTLGPILDALVADGLAVVVPVPLPKAPKRVVVALTAEGQRRARE